MIMNPTFHTCDYNSSILFGTSEKEPKIYSHIKRADAGVAGYLEGIEKNEN